MNGRIIRFGGSAVEIEWEGQPAADLVDFLFRSTPEAGPAAPHVRLHLSADPTGATFTLRGAPEEDRRGPALEVAYSLMERATYHLADRGAEGMLLHAACLSQNGSGLLLAGPSGSGKSTLALWLARQGLAYLTDELAFIPHGSLECQGLARPVHLKPGALRALPELGAGDSLPPGPADGAHSRLVRPAVVAASARLERIVFPHYRPGADLQIEPLSGAQAALTLTGSLVNARNLPDHGFPELLRVCRSVPAWRLSYGSFDSPDLARFLAGSSFETHSE